MRFQDGRVLHRLGFPPVGRHRRFVLALVVDAIGSGVFMPVSILYFVATTSLSLVQVGLALTLASALRLPMTPVLGDLVDRVGPKRVLLAANLVQALGFAAFIVVDSFGAVLAASALVQLGQTGFWGSFSPVVAGIAEPGQRERWFGFLGALRNVSFAVGGMVAAVALTVGTVAAYTSIVVLNAASYLVAFALLLAVDVPTESSHRPSSTERADGLDGPEVSDGWRRILGDRAYLLFVATNASYAISAMALNVAMPVYITQELGLPGWVAGAVFTINTVMIGLGQGLVVNAIQGSVRTNVIALGAVLSLVSYAVMLAADLATVALGVCIVLVAAVVYTGSELVAGPVLAALSTDAAPPHLRGRYVSLYQLSWTLALTVAPVSLTWLMDRGPLALWGGMSAIALAGIALAARLRRVMPLAAATVPDSRPGRVRTHVTPPAEEVPTSRDPSLD